MAESIFMQSYLISGIMCFTGCGSDLGKKIKTTFKALKADGSVPKDAKLFLGSEAKPLGLEVFTIELRALLDPTFEFNPEKVRESFKTAIEELGFNATTEIASKGQPLKSSASNLFNILINVLSVLAISGGYFFLPPSLPLSLGFTFLSFATTGFTAKTYLAQAMKAFKSRDFSSMDFTVSLGWGLALIHSLHHVIQMGAVHSFPMLFMAFIMPLAVVSIVNLMDDIRNRLNKKIQELQMEGFESLLPGMQEEYPCLYPEENEIDFLTFLDGVDYKSAPLTFSPKFFKKINALLARINESHSWQKEKKHVLKPRMLVRVAQDEQFPVDCILLDEEAEVNAASMNGEPCQRKKRGEFLPAGALNLGKPVWVYVREDAYHSSVNRLLFAANYEIRKEALVEPRESFTYLYFSVTGLAMFLALVIPIGFGMASFSLILQNVLGVLFSVCPCTLVIAHELPKLLSIYAKAKQGIRLYNPDLNEDEVLIHTLIFDKTGTLTTGACEVVPEASLGMEEADGLWQRVYLLEKQAGGSHPLAQAIVKYYAPLNQNIKIKTIEEVSKGRGLAAKVQGKYLRLGSHAYLQEAGVVFPEAWQEKIKKQTDKGLTAIYIAEGSEAESLAAKAVIFIRHEVDKDLLDELQALKKDKTLIMLTGDSLETAKGFNQQIGGVFLEENIHAGKSFEDKNKFFETLVETRGKDFFRGLWFIGDGLNDGPSARTVSKNGGVSAAMNPEDHLARFTDLSLKGSLAYLKKHRANNLFLKEKIWQNQALLLSGLFIFLTFLVSFSLAGIALSPLVPMLIMLSTTLFTIFNSYRVTFFIEKKEKPSWLENFFISNQSIALLVMSFTSFLSAVFLASLTTGHFSLPILTFNAGICLTLASFGTLTSIFLLGIFLTLSFCFGLEKQGYGISLGKENFGLSESFVLCPENLGYEVKAEKELVQQVRGTWQMIPPLPIINEVVDDSRRQLGSKGDSGLELKF